MRKIFHLLFVLASCHSFSQNQKSAQAPEYRITRSEKVNSIKNTDAVFEFAFNVWNQTAKKPKIQLSYNGVNKTAIYNKCGMYILHVKPGKYKFKFFASSEYFEITTDSIEIKPGYKTNVNISFRSATEIQYTKKPVIYVYPKQTTAVNIKLDLQGEFSFTYPDYKNGWDFTADPNGTIHIGDKKYEYLFWDGELKMDLNEIKMNEGFVVEKDSLVNFFEKNLTKIGLNARETEDFITFWVPQMQAHNRNYVHFIFNDEYNKYAKLNVTPQPDNILRVLMLWGKMEGKSGIAHTEQKFPSFSRSGFTVVEWGGTEVEEVPGVVYR